MAAAVTALDIAIVGAGAAGLTAAYDLIDASRRNNDPQLQYLDVKVLEARNRIGGRTCSLKAAAAEDNMPPSLFTNLPIDLGGEYLHQDPIMLNEIVNTPTFVLGNGASTIPFQPTSHQYDPDKQEWETNLWPFTDDNKWVNSTWHDFFATYIATPTVRDSVVLGCAVTTIDYTFDPILLTCQDGRQWSAQQVIITVPVPVLQQDITFVPPLPNDYRDAVDDMNMLPGMKVILQFRDKFYFDQMILEDYDFGSESGRLYWNPYTGQEGLPNMPNTNGTHILTVEMSGDYANQYIDMTDAGIVATIIQELDAVFGTTEVSRSTTLASSNLITAFVQNWSKEPFSKGVWSDSNSNSIQTLREPLEGRIIFAGEAIPAQGWWGYVHGAAFSGRYAASLVTATAAPTISPAPTTMPPTTPVPAATATTPPPTTLPPTDADDLLENRPGGAGGAALGPNSIFNNPGGRRLLRSAVVQH